MKKTIIAIECLLLIGAAMLSSVSAADKIKVGALLPLTGKAAVLGEIEQKSMRMAVAEINAAAGSKGRKIDLIIEDTAGNVDGGRAAIKKLIDHHRVRVICGGHASAVVWAAIALAQQSRVPFLVTTAAADRITEQGWNFIFRLNRPVSEHYGALASFVKQIATDLKTVAILHQNTFAGLVAARKFFNRTESLGLRLVIKKATGAETRDFRSDLIKVKAKKPDLIFMQADAAKAALLMRQSRELKVNPKIFLGAGEAFTRPEFGQKVGSASEFVYATTLWTPSVPYPESKKYDLKFRATYNSPPEYHGAQAYAGISVIADAFKRARRLDSKGVRAALAATDMMTAFGPVKFISYEKKNQQNRLPTYLLQWIDGKAEIVWPTKLATKKAIYPMPK